MCALDSAVCGRSAGFGVVLVLVWVFVVRVDCECNDGYGWRSFFAVLVVLLYRGLMLIRGVVDWFYDVNSVIWGRNAGFGL